MAIEKQAIPQPLQPEQEIELEIVQPEIPEDTEVTINPDGSVSIGEVEETGNVGKFGENLAEVIDDKELNSIAPVSYTHLTLPTKA